MKFTSLTTIIISAAAMAGIAIASEDLTIDPIGFPCSPSNSYRCEKAFGTFNNGNDFAYYCGLNGKIAKYVKCDCKNCCVQLPGYQFNCPHHEVSLSFHAAFRVRVLICLISQLCELCNVAWGYLIRSPVSGQRVQAQRQFMLHQYRLNCQSFAT
ncbi:uncharacterized protein EDB93DRAFT_540358 [Suillus bovinus]|uniref:uncharacterized protein n=1 Tax=Suillus bovinus TaxID=48563 RepID=UPI001B878751|nr:uncharacterized protein EDB93DRAFT_540358 [Suillus bovinus]KAG2144427.1 hypothetical protein EDB93DRAFT_540358 [Suillus bovinus]